VRFLDVAGARLYYESHGHGPLMIMIPGAGGAADAFRGVTEHLVAHYTVVLYDRRGFSRSQLDGPQDYDHRLATDADDVRRLIEHLSDQPATVVGFSSGAIVALELLTRHPRVVRTLVPFEPPAVRQLPDGQQWIDFFHEIYDLYHHSGIEAARTKFREKAFPPVDRQAMGRGLQNNPANAAYWFEHELRQYPMVDLDLDALAAHADRIVLAVGSEGRGFPAHDVNRALARKLGRDVLELPGGHGAISARPTDFARDLLRALARN
jgi:acetyltransferase/esterase